MVSRKGNGNTNKYIANSVVSGKFLENPGDENFLSSVSVGMYRKKVWLPSRVIAQ